MNDKIIVLRHKESGEHLIRELVEETSRSWKAIPTGYRTHVVNTYPKSKYERLTGMEAEDAMWVYHHRWRLEEHLRCVISNLPGKAVRQIAALMGYREGMWEMDK